MRPFAGPISLNPIATQDHAHAIKHVIATVAGLKIDSLSFISEKEITNSIIAGLNQSKCEWAFVEDCIWVK